MDLDSPVLNGILQLVMGGLQAAQNTQDKEGGEQANNEPCREPYQRLSVPGFLQR